LVIVTDATPAAAPCGACRQVLAEFGGDLMVESVGPEGTRRWVLKELLPDRFGPEALA
jgi:cytidine deaminase